MQRMLLVVTEYLEHDWLTLEIINKRLGDRHSELKEKMDNKNNLQYL
jgi:hypothetical protein